MPTNEILDEVKITTEQQMRASCIKFAIACAGGEDHVDPSEALKVAEYFFNYCMTGKRGPYNTEDE